LRTSVDKQEANHLTKEIIRGTAIRSRIDSVGLSIERFTIGPVSIVSRRSINGVFYPILSYQQMWITHGVPASAGRVLLLEAGSIHCEMQGVTASG